MPNKDVRIIEHSRIIKEISNATDYLVRKEMKRDGFTMNVKCSNCNKLYNIREEKLPVGEKVAFPCPVCKNIIELAQQSNNDHGSAFVKPKADENHGKSKSSSKPIDKKLYGESLKKKILQSLSDLPAMPQIVLKAQEIISNSNSNFSEFERTLEADQALVTKVLRLANSAYYGQSRKVSSIKKASILLGYDTIAELVTVAGTAKLLNNPLEGYDFRPGEFWRHAMEVAFWSYD